MITKKDLKTYSHRFIEDYYLMVVESAINGQFRQTDEQIKRMSKQQKKEFCTWITNSPELVPADLSGRLFNASMNLI